MPVTPPIVKRNKNPITHILTGDILSIGAPIKEDSHLKILIPVGTAIIIVAEVK
jgi:hypothetical protein